MTEKRFKNVGKDILQYGEWWCSANGEHCADVIATAINELIEENKQLKQTINVQNKCIQELEDWFKKYDLDNVDYEVLDNIMESYLND